MFYSHGVEAVHDVVPCRQSRSSGAAKGLSLVRCGFGRVTNTHRCQAVLSVRWVEQGVAVEADEEFVVTDYEAGAEYVDRNTTGLPVHMRFGYANWNYADPVVIVSQKYEDRPPWPGHCFYMTIAEEPEVLGDRGDISEADVAKAAAFIRLNKRVLLRYWHEPEDFEDGVSAHLVAASHTFQLSQNSVARQHFSKLRECFSKAKSLLLDLLSA